MSVSSINSSINNNRHMWNHSWWPCNVLQIDRGCLAILPVEALNYMLNSYQMSHGFQELKCINLLIHWYLVKVLLKKKNSSHTLIIWQIYVWVNIFTFSGMKEDWWNSILAKYLLFSSYLSYFQRAYKILHFYCNGFWLWSKQK